MFGGFLLLGGRGRRPARTQARLPRRHRRLHGRLTAERPRDSRRAADPRPRAPGPRRRAGLARRALDHHHDVRGGRGADTRRSGVWGAIAAGGAAVGLLLGGGLDRVPLVAVDLLRQRPGRDLGGLPPLRLVPESRDEAHETLRHRRRRDRDRRPDRTRLRDRQVDRRERLGVGQALGLLALAVVLLVAFVVDRAPLAEPLVRLSIFSVRTSRARTCVMLLVAAGLFAMFFFNTLYLQQVLGYSPLEAGLAFLPFTVGIVVGSGPLPAADQPRSGAQAGPGRSDHVPRRARHARSRLTSADGTYLATRSRGSSRLSIGMGLTFVPVTLVATTGVQATDAGLASGLFNTSQQIGGALGLAILSTSREQPDRRRARRRLGRADPDRARRRARLRLQGGVLRCRHPPARWSRPPADDAEEARSRAHPDGRASPRTRLAALQGVERNTERDSQPAVDRPLGVT